MVLIVVCLIPAILLAAEILIKNRKAKIALRILDTMVALVYIAVCMLFAALTGTMIGGETKYMDPLSVTAVIGVVLLGILFLGFVWKWYRRKGFRRFIGTALLLCFLTAGGIVATWQYHSHIAVISATDDLSKYNLKREDNILVNPDWEPTLKLTANYPVMDGATALYPVYAAFGLKLYPKELLTSYYSNGAAIQCTQTNHAYINLINNQCDVIFVASPSKEQEEKAAEAGVELVYTPIGRECFVFFVNSKNPLDNISSSDLRRIYSGELTKWEDLGVKNFGDIRPFQRAKNSGSQTYLYRFMGDTPTMEPETTQVTAFMEGIITKVADYKNYKNAIGFSFRFYASEMVQNDQIKLLSIDGAAPTRENIINGTYPLSGEFYAVTRSDASEETKQLIDWILTDQGQEIIEKTGYVSLRE